MRCFLAVPLSDDARAAIDAQMRRLRPALPEGRFVNSTHLHVTLHFFENLSEADVAKADVSARAGLLGRAPFEVRLAGLDVFPDARRPRVLWVGITTGAGRLAGIREAVGTELRVRGLPVDGRPFRPHLTLARFRAPPRNLASAMALVADQPGASFPADRVVLFRSDLRPEGAVHTPLSVVPITG